jgi:hypothetical protein
MTRELTTAVDTAITSPSISPFFAIDLLYDSPNELYLWTGYGNKVISGKTYGGIGNLISLSSVQETSEISATGANIKLSGVNSEILELAIQTPYQGRVCNIYFGVRSDYSEYTEVFTGYMDQMNIEENPEGALIELVVQNKLVTLERPVVRKYTAAHQKSRFSGDLGLDFVASIQDKKLNWGGKLEVSSTKKKDEGDGVVVVEGDRGAPVR